MESQQHSSSSSAASNYFDLVTRGIGYVNRIRDVSGGKGRRNSTTLWCSISALRGEKGAPTYTHYDCRVTGAEAQRVIRMCEQAVHAERRVLIGFNMGDSYPEAFTYMNGERKGEVGVVIKSRLLRVLFAKVDGESVYQAPRDDSSKHDSNQEQPPSVPGEQDSAGNSPD